MSITLGQKFSCFAELKDAIDKYETSNYVKLWIRNSRKIDYARKVAAHKARYDNQQLVYSYIKYTCINGGEKFRTNGKGHRNTSTFRQNCPAHIYASLSENGQNLEIKSINETHNHEVSKELFKNLFHQRRLNEEERRKVANLLSLNISKKEVVSTIQAETNKVVLLKDVVNIQQRMGKKSSKNNLQNTISLLEERHKAIVDTYVENNNFLGLFFQDDNMKKSFEAYPEFLCCDTTCELLELGLLCFLLLVEDSNGQSEIVGVGLLVQDSKESLHWLLNQFSNQNPKASETRMIMTGSDWKEQDVLRNVFPQAQLIHCRFHTMKTFKRQITCERFAITTPERDRVLEILQKLTYSRSTEEYDSLYSQFSNTAPSRVLDYFNENWHPIRDEWIMCSEYSSGGFLNFTSNRLEGINSRLRSVINKNCSLEEFVDKFYIVFDAMCKEQDNKVSKIIYKTPVQKLKGSSEDKYQFFLTPYAYQMVMKQLSASEKIERLELDAESEIYIIHSSDGPVNTNTLQCTCYFNSSMCLPCCHIFAVRKILGLDLFDENCCSERWSAAYYKKYHRLFRPVHTPNDSDEDLLAYISNKRILSSFEKYKKADRITSELSRVLSQCPIDIFENRYKQLIQLLEIWKMGEEAFVMQVDNILQCSPANENEETYSIQIQSEDSFAPVNAIENETVENIVIDGEYSFTPTVLETVMVESAQIAGEHTYFASTPVQENEEVESIQVNVDPPFIVQSKDISSDASVDEVPVKAKQQRRSEDIDWDDLSTIKKRLKVEEQIAFSRKSFQDKQIMLLSWFVNSDISNRCVRGQYIVRKDDIFCDCETLTPAVLHQQVGLFIIQKFFTYDAWRFVQKIYKRKKKNHKWVCEVCSQTLAEKEPVCCDGCLLWNHCECVALRTRPKSWFCTSCMSLAS